MTTNHQGKQDNRRMVPLRYVLIPFALIAIAIVLLIVVVIFSPKPAKKTINNKAPLVEVQPIKRETIRFEIASQGVVEPRTQTQIISEVSGKVIAVNDKFNVGGYFKKGEVLVTIDDINYQVAVLQAQSRYEGAQARLTEQQARHEQAKQEWRLTGKKLSQAPVLALRTPQLLQAQADLKAAEADLKSAKVNLERTKIKAPYDAMVKAKNVDIGQFVAMGSPIATTFAVDYAEVRLPIKQQDIEFLDLAKIHQRQAMTSPVTITYRINGKTHQWRSQLVRYEGEVDRNSRVHYVVAQINDPYGILLDTGSNNNRPELRIGTFVKAHILGKTVEDIITIPRSALHETKQLYVINAENKLHIQDITVLRGDKHNIYSHDDIEDDFRLVTTQLKTPVENMTLRVVGEENKQEAIQSSQGEGE